MADLDHQHNEFTVLDIADDPVVANPITPVGTEYAPLKWFSKASRVVVFGKTLFQKRGDALGIFPVQLVELLFRLGAELNRPGQVSVSLLQVCMSARRS